MAHNMIFCQRMLNNIFSHDKTLVLFSSVWIFTLFSNVLTADGKVWKDVTACYGADDDCSRYQMECTSGTTIVLGKLMYGTKKEGIQDCQYGISNCKEKDKVAACCTYNSSDIFTPFSATNLSAVFENCEGKTECAGWAPRLATTPFSSYVWMQYACVNEKNATDMCKNSTIAGNNLFIRFNMTKSSIHSSWSTSQDCSCRISTPSCDVAITTTLVDLDFDLPKRAISSAKLDSSSSTCSSSSLDLVSQNESYSCQNTQLFTNRHTFERMTEITLQSRDEIVTLKDVNAGGVINGPNYIMLYFKTSPYQPLLVNCFEPGIQTSTANRCQTTTSTHQPSTKTSTLLSTIASVVYNSTYEASPGVSSDSTSTISSFKPSTDVATTMPTAFQASSMKLSTQSKPFISSTFTTESSHQTFSAKTKTHTTQEQSSSSVSQNTFQQTLPFSKESSTEFPSTKVPSRPFSYFGSHSTSTSSSPTYSISTLISTSTETLSLTEQSESPITNIVTMNITEDTSVATATSPLPTKAASVPNISAWSTSNVSTTIVTTLSESTDSNNLSHSVTTDSVDKNNSTNLNQSTAGADDTTHSTGATTTKTTDDSGNNNGVIIGVTVAVVIVVLIIVAVIMVCLCIRIKRKEKVRRNYIRNTNIFYSFPEDCSDAGNTLSESSPEAGRRGHSFSTIPRSQLYESVGNPSPSSTLKKATSPLYFDQYKIKEFGLDHTNISYDKDPLSFSRTMPNDNSYVGETSNETIDFVNDVENDDSLKVDSNSNVENGSKSVQFDPSVYYAKVRKEGKTKF